MQAGVVAKSGRNTVVLKLPAGEFFSVLVSLWPDWRLSSNDKGRELLHRRE